MPVPYDRSWRLLPDEELRRWLGFYRRRLALVDAEVADPFEREPTRQFLALLVGDAGREEAGRRRAADLGVPRERDQFPADFIADLKARVKLDELLEYEAGARLGREVGGKRQGPCPLCRRGANCFTVYVADAADQHYYCFRCGARGDAITAIMQVYGEPFRAAVEHLARNGHVPLPAPPPDAGAPQRRYLAIARGEGPADA